jgi:hypothetical protein
LQITARLINRDNILAVICKNLRQYLNVAERAIRPLTIGRKNWLFFGSQEVLEARAILFSIVQTCRCLGINPREYLEDVLCKFMSHPAKNLDELLLDKWFARKKENSI